MPLQAVIFDFDGVVVNSEHYWVIGETEFFHKVIPNWKDKDHHRIVGMRILDSYEFLKKEHNMQISFEEYLQNYDRIAERVYAQCSPIKGVMELLTVLKKAGLLLGIASSARRRYIEHVLSQTHLDTYFKTITSAEDVPEGEGKPSPTIYLLTAQALHVEPQNCIAIEDSTNGIESAKEAGMICIGLQTPDNKQQNLSRADLQITSFSDLNIDKLQAITNKRISKSANQLESSC